ncbi:MAG: hypothetical protein GX271_01435 [Clostridiales bacterium]|nr:hypothetical protein [Clostridiales bacterium]
MNILKKAGVFAVTLLLSLTMLSSFAYAADYTIVPNDSLYHIGLLFRTSDPLRAPPPAPLHPLHPAPTVREQ